MRARTAERAVIQQQLTEGQVLAPAAGRVLKVPVTVGSVVLPGDAVAHDRANRISSCGCGCRSAMPGC